MGQTPTDKIERWVSAAGQTGKSQVVIDRVAAAGEFLEKTARLNEAQACQCLTGIDFSKAVEVVRLPNHLYVQYVQKHRGMWFTDTGLTPDAVGLADGKRVRTLFKPAGGVVALKSKARAVKDTWTIDRLFQSLSPSSKKKVMGQLTQGGGTQYVVANKFAMEEV
jgi:hypothetical protein